MGEQRPPDRRRITLLLIRTSVARLTRPTANRSVRGMEQPTKWKSPSLVSDGIPAFRPGSAVVVLCKTHALYSAQSSYQIPIIPPEPGFEPREEVRSAARNSPHSNPYGSFSTSLPLGTRTGVTGFEPLERQSLRFLVLYFDSRSARNRCLPMLASDYGRDGIRTRDRKVRNLSPYPLGHTPSRHKSIKRRLLFRLGLGFRIDA